MKSQKDKLDLRLFFTLTLFDLINRRILSIEFKSEEIYITKDFNYINFKPKNYESRFLRMFKSEKMGYYEIREYIDFVLIDTFNDNDWLEQAKQSGNLQNLSTDKNNYQEMKNGCYKFSTKYFNFYKLPKSEITNSQEKPKGVFDFYSFSKNRIDAILMDKIFEICHDYISIKRELKNDLDWKNYNSIKGGF